MTAFKGVLTAGLLSLLLVGCEGYDAAGADYEALEGEVNTLREDYDALRTEFDAFREGLGVGEVGE